MAKLIVTRVDETMNRLRSIELFIDGQKTDTISNGTTKELELAEGTHTLRAKIDWCGSRDYTFYVAAGDVKSVTVSSFGYKNNFTIIFCITLALNFFERYVYHTNYLMWVAICMMPVAIYFISAGRNDYLVINTKD